MTSTNTGSLTSKVAKRNDMELYKKLHWEGSFDDYLDIVRQHPEVTRNAYQRLYDLIVDAGQSEYVDAKKKLISYNFFKDESNNGANAIFGLDIPLMRLMNVLRGARESFGPEKRILLMCGPVGSSKSTIARLIKKGVESYSKTDAGALYTFTWTGLKAAGLSKDEDTFASPMNEEPLRLIPVEWRKEAIEDLKLSNDNFKVKVEGEMDPASRFIFKALMEKYNGDWEAVMQKHVRVRRLVLSEKDRVGIGTFQPKDEKNQDATELTGDINYRKIAEYGSDSDPRSFNFDGEFNIANRGVVEFVEVLKLDTAFLYDLLGASQEHSIKPKKFAQTDIDEVILGHTNEAEYNKLINNEFMEALRDRTIKIDVPYITRVSEEIKIYQKDFSQAKIKSKHIAPHSLAVAAMWATLTRLSDPKKHNLTVLQKMKLYDGKTIPGFTVDTIRELRKESKREGHEGISPRYIQDRISNALVDDHETINPFIVLNELEKGLSQHSLINNEDKRKRYEELISVTKRELEAILTNEVQRAISADEEAIAKLCANYIDNVKASTMKERVKNKYTGQDEEPDERLMRSIENEIEIPENRKMDFRRELMNFVGSLSLEGKKFDWRSNERLRKALEMKLFADSRDTIKLQTLVSAVQDKSTLEKIDLIKARLISNFGYNSTSATDVLNFVASIFARQTVKD